MLERAIDAARQAGAQCVAVVCGEEARAKCGHLIDRVIPEHEDGAENVRSALRAFEGDVVYLSSDLPFINVGALRDFLARVPCGAIGMPLADAAAYESRFPAAPTHATVIGHERIANGSVFMFPAGSATNIIKVAERFFNSRKSLLRMAALLGPQLLVKYAFHKLRIDDIEHRAAAVLDFPARAIRDCAPELCYDIDDVDDYLYACEHA